MRILQINNRTRLGGGQDKAVDQIRQLLQKKGLDISLLQWDSRDIGMKFCKKLIASLSGIYSLSAAKRIVEYSKKYEPDIILVHNVYPLVSPSVLVSARRMGIPTVMICHNYRLTCPTYMHLRNSEVCELCSGGKEFNCIINNCRRNIFESLTYALHNATARKLQLFKKYVTVFVSWSPSFKDRLVQDQFRSEQIVVIPRLVEVPDRGTDPDQGEYVAYSGRLSAEKGISTLIDAATQLPDIPFHLAGDGPWKNELSKTLPENVALRGWLQGPELEAFYRKARCLVVPSLSFETFGAVAGEAMANGLPVIASRRSSLADVVEDGITGLLFEPGNVEDLVGKIRMLQGRPDLCRQLGESGRRKAIREYSEDVFYNRLLKVFERAIEIERVRTFGTQ